MPSSGNLGSPAAFILARNIEDLDPGAYFYLEAEHTLARVETAAHNAVIEIFASIPTTDDVEPPDALLVLIGSYARISVKYGAFAYRLAHFDSGLVIEHLRTLSDSFGLIFHEMSGWPNNILEETLAIDSQETPIMTVIGLSAFDPLRLTASSLPLEKRESKECFEDFLPRNGSALRMINALSDDWDNRNDLRAATLAHEIHRVSQAEMPPTWERCMVKPLENEDADGSPLHSSKSELWSQLLTRKSVRHYEDTVVQPNVAATILGETRISALLRARTLLVKVVVTLRIEPSGKTPTWQTYELSGNGQLIYYTGTAAISGSIDALFVDGAVAEAPLLFWFCGDVRHGPLQYRRMLIEAGRQVHAVMQAASCFGLEGYPVAGIWPKRVASVLGLRFCEETPLLSYACGLPKMSHPGE